MFNNRLQWNTHVDYVVKKANRMLGFVLSVSKSLARVCVCACVCYICVILQMNGNKFTVTNTNRFSSEFVVQMRFLYQ